MSHDGGLPDPFGRRPLPPGFRRRRTVIPPGGSLPYLVADWAGAIVLVERGAVDFECHAGARRRFRRGDVVWLQGLGLRRLQNPGEEPAVLLAIYRSAL